MKGEKKMTWERIRKAATRLTAFTSILVFLIVAFEIMIMISPFAFFFYSVFNPFSIGWASMRLRGGLRPSSCRT